MDINTGTNIQTTQAMPLPAQRPNPPLPKTTPKATDTKTEAAPQTIPEGEEARQAYVERAAETYKSMFPISGVSFAIFKDANTGEFITRFTNLADGTVTQIPESELIDFHVRSNGGEAPMLSLES